MAQVICTTLHRMIDVESASFAAFPSSCGELGCRICDDRAASFPDRRLRSPTCGVLLVYL